MPRPTPLRDHEATIHDLRHRARLACMATDGGGPLDRDQVYGLSWSAHHAVERAERWERTPNPAPSGEAAA